MLFEETKELKEFADACGLSISFNQINYVEADDHIKDFFESNDLKYLKYDQGKPFVVCQMRNLSSNQKESFYHLATRNKNPWHFLCAIIRDAAWYSIPGYGEKHYVFHGRLKNVTQGNIPQFLHNLFDNCCLNNILKMLLEYNIGGINGNQ